MEASATWVRRLTSLWHFWPRAKQHIWQVLPLCPTGYGNSPYAGSSAFAGNPSLISLEVLRDWGWIGAERIAGLTGGAGAVNFADVEARKFPLLHEAAGNFLDRALDEPATGRTMGGV